MAFQAFPALLDACVLIPYPLFDVLLRLADAGAYRPLWSATILDEVERNCVGKLGLDAERVASRIRDMRSAFPDAEVTGYERLIESMGNHPKDRHVLAAAVVANADLIVTANLKDFPDAALAPFGLGAIHPDAFLLDIYDLYPAATRAAMRDMLAANSRPPGTVVELVEFLKPTVPRFASTLKGTLP